MKASHNLARVSVSFDEDHLVPNGGLTVAALLAQKLGVGELVDDVKGHRDLPLGGHVISLLVVT